MSVVRVPLTDISALPDGELRRFRVGIRGVWVCKEGENVRAFYDACTHQGGAMQLRGNTLQCMRHGACFDAQSGTRLSGEAPEGSRLPPAEVVVDQGKLFLLLPDND